MKKFPEEGRSKAELLRELERNRKMDADWESGRTLGYVFHPGPELYEVIKEAHNMYFSENALNPSVFPSLRKMETALVSMVIDLLNGGADATGSMTSGGTESILMAIKSAKTWASKHKPNIFKPEIIIPESAHPAFHKAFDYFGITARVAKLGPDFRADIGAMRGMINSRTIMLIGSAPSFPQGVVDPITEIAALAREYGILCHVDACMGGFLLPFAKQLGYQIPPFDLSVDGVTSISADLHKYGYGPKGTSFILYNHRELRKHQFFAYTSWSGGIYASPTVTGTRSGGNIAAGWATVNFLGTKGYLELTRSAMETAKAIMNGIAEIPELRILGEPDMCIFSIGSDDIDVYEVADEMGILGWHLDRQQNPPSIHLTINNLHKDIPDAFLKDLRKAVKVAKSWNINKLGNRLQVKAVEQLSRILPDEQFKTLTQRAASGSPVGAKRSAAMYGMMGTLEGAGSLHDLAIDFLDELNSPPE